MHTYCLRPYHPEHTQSHLISEAKQGQGLVSTWMEEAYHLKKKKKSNFSFELVIRGCNIQSKPGITENRSFTDFFSFKGSQSVSIEGKLQASQGQWPVLPLSSLHLLHLKEFLTHHRPQLNKHMRTDSFSVWQNERMNKWMAETRGKHGYPDSQP